MQLAPGKTLNELAYMNPDVLEENSIRIAFQLGMHTAFSYAFGVKDGYQSNYLFDEHSKTITRIDNEKFLRMPDDPEKTLEDNHHYAQDIASCEMENLKYIPYFRRKEGMDDILKAFNTGFMEKYRELKQKKNTLLKMIEHSRHDTFQIRPGVDEKTYQSGTKKIMHAVGHLIDQEPEKVLKRLYKARNEIK